jgi:prepilin-type N-terminal cleavage/methylation domain-containing protein
MHAIAKRARSRGYTVVEVLSAMTLFAIGAAGVISMQRVTIQGGTDARRFDVATNIAREWQHRLQVDSFRWTEPDSVVTTSNRTTRTQWLQTVENASSGTPPSWRVPVRGSLPIPGHSSAFDVLGRDVDIQDENRMFCVHYRLSWIAPEGPAPTALIRAEIRVYWPRLEQGTPDCEDLAPNPNQHHFVQLATTLRGNPTR